MTLMAGLLAVIAAGIGASSAPAEAAQSEFVTRPFSIVNGNNHSTGTVTFYNRSVNVSGTQNAESTASPLKTQAWTFSGPRSFGYGWSALTAQAGVEEPFGFTVSADVAGGATSVFIRLYGLVDGTLHLLGTQSVER